MLILSKMKINVLWGSYDLLLVYLSSWVKFIRVQVRDLVKILEEEGNIEENKNCCIIVDVVLSW